MRILLTGALVIAIASSAVAQTKPAPAPKAAPPAAAAVPAPKPLTEAQQKDLDGALSLLNLDSLAVQQAQASVMQSDPVAKKAIQILNTAFAQAAEVQKANADLEKDRKTLLDKIDAIRKEQGLPAFYDWVQGRPTLVDTSKPAVSK